MNIPNDLLMKLLGSILTVSWIIMTSLFVWVWNIDRAVIKTADSIVQIQEHQELTYDMMIKQMTSIRKKQDRVLDKIWGGHGAR